jgi:ATP-binding cassette, subfamily C (CFTR/MRP), member 1
MHRDTVRARLLAITQDYFSLPDTVAQNLDSYCATPDPAALETALRRVGLWETVRDRGGLDRVFDEDLLSHGQRQLFSLARALQRKSGATGGGRMALVDEATGSVDADTEARMREILHEESDECTIIAVAH